MNDYRTNQTLESDNAQSPIFRPSEAAAYLRICDRTLQMLRGTSQGPEFFKVGGSFRYTKAALDKYINEQMNLANARAKDNVYHHEITGENA